MFYIAWNRANIKARFLVSELDLFAHFFVPPKADKLHLCLLFDVLLNMSQSADNN